MHRQEGRGAARERGGTARRGRAPPEEGASRQEGGGRHQETGGSARRGGPMQDSAFDSKCIVRTKSVLKQPSVKPTPWVPAARLVGGGWWGGAGQGRPHPTRSPRGACAAASSRGGVDASRRRRRCGVGRRAATRWGVHCRHVKLAMWGRVGGRGEHAAAVSPAEVGGRRKKETAARAKGEGASEKGKKKKKTPGPVESRSVGRRAVLRGKERKSKENKHSTRRPQRLSPARP